MVIVSRASPRDYKTQCKIAFETIFIPAVSGWEFLDLTCPQIYLKLAVYENFETHIRIFIPNWSLEFMGQKQKSSDILHMQLLSS